MTAFADTIFALASPPGRGGIAVVRVSGPGSLSSLEALAGAPVRADRRAVLRRLADPGTGRAIDRALVVAFEGPRSYTGEDVVEYHLHGGKAIVEALLAALAARPGHRPAEPGEFTRRAFENGRMDLTEAEAVADLIDAETALQQEQALAQMEGGLSRLYAGWTETLSRLLARLEADIDFPDEDLPQGLLQESKDEAAALLKDIETHLKDARRGERMREGFRIAVLGAPNAGKSTLVNAISGREAAIVSALPGTTRDVIETHLDIGGYPVILSDTAGLRDTPGDPGGHGEIEREGMRRALSSAREADLRLLVFDASLLPARDAHTQALAGADSLVVFNKSDLCAGEGGEGLHISAATGEGVSRLTDMIAARLSALAGDRAAPPPTRRRHRAALEDASASLSRAVRADLPELAAEDLRLALRAIGRITGRVDVEDLLDIIFRDFCIGK